jgi:hypothetical protein
MTSARLGGYLLLGGAIVLGFAIVVLALYGGIGHATVGGFSFATSLALIGLAGLVLAVGRPQPIGSRTTRIGVGMFAFGLVCMSAFSFMNAFVQTDPLEVLPMILAGGIGYLAILAGVIVTIASLAWRGVRRRAS